MGGLHQQPLHVSAADARRDGACLLRPSACRCCVPRWLLPHPPPLNSTVINYRSYILAGQTGTQRGSPIASEFAGYVSDSGSYVAAVGRASAFIYTWSAATSAYAVSQTIAAPTTCTDGCPYPWDVAMSSDAAEEYAAFGE